MQFEYDPNKSTANKAKHGIDFEDAQRIWDDDEEISMVFELDPFRRQCLLNGLDDIGLTQQHEDKIRAFEASQ